jgi:ribulose-phosphate 3-epimerase
MKNLRSMISRAGRHIAKKISKLPISAHLELLRPETFLPMFARAGVDILTFQLDACPNPIHLLKEIKKAGMKAGIGIGPAYSVEGLRYILHHVDWLILMSVEPGYGGQTFEESVYEKIHQAKALMDELGHHVPISIDGGVNDVTGKKLIEAGADILIAGSYIFKDNKVAERVQTLKAL